MSAKTLKYTLTASEFDWEISENKKISAWGFNGSVPGPQLRARKGDNLVIRVKNELKEPTIIHWHGIRLYPEMDGTDNVQKPIPPGEEFEYRFEVPDAGTFWYHSHHNETEQMEKGMYGSLIVEDINEPIVDRERTLMIDDMKLSKDNNFKKHGRIGRWIERHDGREGETLLINGKENPAFEIAAGHVERWRIINASSARYFRLFLGGKTFRLIGTDGGMIQAPVNMTELLITPGERAEILVGPFESGEVIGIDSLAYNRVTFLRPKRQRFGKLRVGPAKPSIANIPSRLRKITTLAPANAKANRQVKLSVGASFRNGIDFLVNNKLHASDAPVNLGELQIWEVSNSSLMDHPFHLHGFFFQVLEVNGESPEFLSWKDTVNLPPRSKTKIAWMPDNRTGRWMYHCHILEHHEAGMMAHFDVVDPANPIRVRPRPHMHKHH